MDFPFFSLKKEYKKKILSSAIMQATIADFFGVSIQSVIRWINEDSPRITDFNFLNIVWSMTYSPDRTLKITELLTIQS